MIRVAQLGLGIMGNGMAINLLKAGFPLSVYNRTSSRADALVAQGAQAAPTPREAAHDADVIFAMVGDDDASRAVWLGEHGALAGAKPGAVLVECSTLSLAWVRELAAVAAERGLKFLDAPVTGSKDAAEAGQLKLMVGGDAGAIEQARPALAAVSQQIIHFGPSGAGATMKLINNLMGAVQTAALAEGMALAERAGLDSAQVVALITNGAPGSPIVKSKIGMMVAHSYADTNFALRWMHKDATYALRAADELGVPMPTVAAARELYRLARNLGHNDDDFAAVIEALRQRA
ncbi:NAD(P)-dependent oxidoreductase [Kouleothrix sp.]|uniref:NAD(P)-dependent oxidoreductase n=1 Tax=Kouleothrix sp. TaxID=2779161 RepID=UPI0039191C34